MKLTILMTVAIITAATSSFADETRINRNGTSQTKDSYGRWTNSDNLYKDTDRDGVMNKYDSNDRDPNVSTQSRSSYENSYSSGSNSLRSRNSDTGYGNGGSRSRY